MRTNYPTIELLLIELLLIELLILEGFYEKRRTIVQ